MTPDASAFAIESCLAEGVPAREERRVWSLIAPRLGVRIHGRAPLRAMLDDYLYGIQPGSRNSLLCGADASELARLRNALRRELIGALRDVAEAVEVTSPEALLCLANRLASADDEKDVLVEWIRCARMAASDADFLALDA